MPMVAEKLSCKLMLAAANASGERRTDIAMTAACTMMQAAYLYMYVNGYYVY